MCRVCFGMFNLVSENNVLCSVFSVNCAVPSVRFMLCYVLWLVYVCMFFVCFWFALCVVVYSVCSF